MNGTAGKKTDAAIINRAVQLAKGGSTVDQISKRLNVSKTSVRNWLKKQEEGK